MTRVLDRICCAGRYDAGLRVIQMYSHMTRRAAASSPAGSGGSSARKRAATRGSTAPGAPNAPPGTNAILVDKCRRSRMINYSLQYRVPAGLQAGRRAHGYSCRGRLIARPRLACHRYVGTPIRARSTSSRGLISARCTLCHVSGLSHGRSTDHCCGLGRSRFIRWGSWAERPGECSKKRADA
jgi:hypothetical protein